MSNFGGTRDTLRSDLPWQRRLARSQSTPSPLRSRRTLATSSTEPESLLGLGRAPVVDWANIDQALTEEVEPLDEAESEAPPHDQEALTRTISYVSLPSPSGSSGDEDSDLYSSSSSSSSSLSSFETGDQLGNLGYYDYGAGPGSGRKRRRRGPHDKKLSQVTVPLSLSLTVMLGYVIFGSFLFTIWEQTDYIKWSYFCFITLSTIGFGDIVPGTEVDSRNPKEKLIATTLYVAVGLSVFAMCFKLMQEEVIEKMRRLGRRLGIIARREPPPQPLPKARRSKASRRARRKRRKKRQKRREKAKAAASR
uniref:Ion_trans_2 domain-containing protein n=2 Tax=Macrostomum lignano TaxID=282301 RepID=A0A1I8J569_9PLAT